MSCPSKKFFYKKKRKTFPKPSLGFSSFSVFLSSSSEYFWEKYNTSSSVKKNIKRFFKYAISDGKSLIKKRKFTIYNKKNDLSISLDSIKQEISLALSRDSVLQFFSSLALIGMLKFITKTYNSKLNISNKDYYLPIIFKDKGDLIASITDLNFLLFPVWKKYQRFFDQEYSFIYYKINHIFKNYYFSLNKKHLHVGFTNFVRKHVHRKRSEVSAICSICGAKEDVSVHHIIPLSVLPILSFDKKQYIEDIDNQITICNSAHNNGGGIEKLIAINELFSNVELNDLNSFRIFYLDYGILMFRYYLFLRLIINKEKALLTDILLDELDELVKLGRFILNVKKPSSSFSKGDAFMIHKLKI